MPDQSDERRDKIHQLLVELGPADPMRPAVLTGWVVVASWMDDEGNKWLSRGFAAELAKWHADGMLHEALYGDWSESE